MFNFIVENICNRYTREELSNRYNVNLPCKETNKSLFKNVNEANRIDGNFYELNNSNSFTKFKGNRAHATILTEENAIFFEERLSWLQKLLLSIMMFFLGLKLRILNYIDSLISKIPKNLRLIIRILLNIILLPLTLILIVIGAIQSAKQTPGGIFGFIIGIFFAVCIVIPIKILFEIIGILISPIVNKLADSMIDKPIIRKMVIGNYMNNNILDNGIIITENMVDNLTFEIRKNLLGMESLYVVLKEGIENVSFVDKVLSKLLPNYFVNKRTVFVTKTEYKENFENLFQK